MMIFHSYVKLPEGNVHVPMIFLCVNTLSWSPILFQMIIDNIWMFPKMSPKIGVRYPKTIGVPIKHHKFWMIGGSHILGHLHLSVLPIHWLSLLKF